MNLFKLYGQNVRKLWVPDDFTGLPSNDDCLHVVRQHLLWDSTKVVKRIENMSEFICLCRCLRQPSFVSEGTEALSMPNV